MGVVSPVAPGGGATKPGQQSNWRTLSGWFRASGAPAATVLSATGANAALVANQTQFMPWDNPAPVTVNSWAIYVAVVGVGGTQTVGLALYNADPVTSLPTTRALSVDTIAPLINCVGGTASAWRTGAFSASVTVPAGRWWVATAEANAGGTTSATVGYATTWDYRVAYGSPGGNIGFGNALYRNQSVFVDNPTFLGNAWLGRVAWLFSPSG